MKKVEETTMTNIKETEEFIIELCREFDEETRKSFEYWKGNKKISPEDVFMAKFGFLELAYEKEEAIKKAREMVESFLYRLNKDGEKFKVSFRAFEDDYDSFLELFKYDQEEELYLWENDILLKRNQMILDLL